MCGGRGIVRRVLGIVAHAAVREKDRLGRLVKVAHAPLAVQGQVGALVVCLWRVVVKDDDGNAARRAFD